MLPWEVGAAVSWRAKKNFNSVYLKHILGKRDQIYIDAFLPRMAVSEPVGSLLVEGWDVFPGHGGSNV